MDSAAIAAAVQKEIERQQANVCYDDLPKEDLERAIENLQARLAMCQAAVEARAGGAKKEAPKMVATKVEGDWPELPWGGTPLPKDSMHSVTALSPPAALPDA